MSTLSQFMGGARPPKQLINRTSAGGISADEVGPAGPSVMRVAKAALTGALTADTLSTVLSLTGAGSVGFVACTSVDATSRTHRFKLTIDGVVVYDAAVLETTSTSRGIQLIGATTSLGGAFAPVFDPVPFNTSFLLEYASSLTETANTNIYYNYRMY